MERTQAHKFPPQAEIAITPDSSSEGCERRRTSAFLRRKIENTVTPPGFLICRQLFSWFHSARARPTERCVVLPGRSCGHKRNRPSTNGAGRTHIGVPAATDAANA